MAPGEQIYLVQYYKVCYRWFVGNKVDKITLAKKIQWERYNRPRYLQSKIKDIIEVELEDDEIALEGDYNECAIESREVFISNEHINTNSAKRKTVTQPINSCMEPNLKKGYLSSEGNQVNIVSLKRPREPLPHNNGPRKALKCPSKRQQQLTIITILLL